MTKINRVKVKEESKIEMKKSVGTGQETLRKNIERWSRNMKMKECNEERCSKGRRRGRWRKLGGNGKGRERGERGGGGE